METKTFSSARVKARALQKTNTGRLFRAKNNQLIELKLQEKEDLDCKNDIELNQLNAMCNRL